MRRRRLLIGATGAAIVTAPARAQTFPAKPLRLIVPFTPGGTTDILAREIAAKLQIAFGQGCVVGSHVASEIERWRPVVKVANIRLG